MRGARGTDEQHGICAETGQFGHKRAPRAPKKHIGAGSEHMYSRQCRTIRSDDDSVVHDIRVQVDIQA